MLVGRYRPLLPLRLDERRHRPVGATCCRVVMPEHLRSTPALHRTRGAELPRDLCRRRCCLPPCATVSALRSRCPCRRRRYRRGTRRRGRRCPAASGTSRRSWAVALPTVVSHAGLRYRTPRGPPWGERPLSPLPPLLLFLLPRPPSLLPSPLLSVRGTEATAGETRAWRGRRPHAGPAPPWSWPNATRSSRGGQVSARLSPPVEVLLVALLVVLLLLPLALRAPVPRRKPGLCLP